MTQILAWTDSDTGKRLFVEIGGVYTFDYPHEFICYPDHSAHRGQQVTVLREMTAEEVTYEDGLTEMVYEIEAADGWRGMGV